MKILAAFAVFFLPLVTGGPAARADDYLGAEAVLKQVEAQSAGARDSARQPSPTRQLRLDVRSYQEHAAGLPPEQAARDWLALFDRAVTLPEPQDQSSYQNGSNLPPRLLPVLAVLPPPVAWDALAAQIAARPLPPKGSANLSTPVLRAVVGTLQGDRDAARQAIEQIKRQVNDSEQTSNRYDWSVDNLQDAFFTSTGDKQGILTNFEAKLALLKPDAGSTADVSARKISRSSELHIPNLVELAGVPRAETLLRQVFVQELPGIELQDDRTKALARRVAVEMGSQLKFAPWNLVDTLDSIVLYELLDKRFPNIGTNDQRPNADAYYLLALISRGRSDDATTLALKLNRTAHNGDAGLLSYLPEEALTELAGKGYAKEVYRFFDRMLPAHLDLPSQHSFITVAVLAGETDAMLAKIKAASERADLKPAARTALRKDYGDALLAADYVAEALPVLRELVAAKVSETAETEMLGSVLQEQVDAVTSLASLGQLLGDDALVNEQLDAVVKITRDHLESVKNVYLPENEDLNELFLAMKRGPERERMLAASLGRGRFQADGVLALLPTSFSFEQAEQYFSLGQSPLYALADLYYRTGRYQDIVTLLDRAPGWGAEDVKTLLDPNHSSSGPVFGTQVARALQKTGHPDAALRLIDACLERNGGSDPSYALLLELLPPDRAEARLDELFQHDQFEERPLIWRAFLQLGQNRLDEAEKSARQAIAIDPSDGEQGRGDRMRAYAVLGDILERKGNPEKAAQMRQAVQAIRLSEDADRFHEAGLLTRAVGMYEKALGYFADAYCIQSRLAIQLTTLGKLDEAAAHYERAYELMPESFGRMESHCLGCEHAFKGERAQATADRVFQQLAARQPDNPRVHYLLGYLRGEQERNAEAARECREAVRLDPDYINAWKQLASVAEDPADRDRAQINLLRLDPRRHHASTNFAVVSDLRALWAAAEAAAKFAVPEVASVYPLAASKAFLEQERQRHAAKPTDGDDLKGLGGATGETLTPRAAILENTIIALALQLLRGDDSGG